MKRYLLFAGERYYPSGGGKDFIDSFGDKREAIKEGGAMIATNAYDWFNVFDLELGRIVEEGND